jgi:hypothetical protein
MNSVSSVFGSKWRISSAIPKPVRFAAMNLGPVNFARAACFQSSFRCARLLRNPSFQFRGALKGRSGGMTGPALSLRPGFSSVLAGYSAGLSDLKSCRLLSLAPDVIGSLFSAPFCFGSLCAPAAWAIAVALKSASVAAAIINLLVILLLRTSHHWGPGSALCSELVRSKPRHHGCINLENAERPGACPDLAVNTRSGAKRSQAS